MTDETSTTPPIVCDMTDAPDTAIERLAEYERLFEQSLIGREHTEEGVRFRFRATEGVEGWVRDLAAREKACCGFFSYTVQVHDDEEVWWDMTVVDDDLARQVLEEFYRLPDSLFEGASALLERFTGRGLQVMINDGGALRPATMTELGL